MKKLTLMSLFIILIFTTILLSPPQIREAWPQELTNPVNCRTRNNLSNYYSDSVGYFLVVVVNFEIILKDLDRNICCIL